MPRCRISPFLIAFAASCTSHEPSPDSARAFAHDSARALAHDSTRTFARDSGRPAVAAAAATDSAANAPPSRWVVTPRGYGPVLAGSSLASLATTLGEPLRATYASGSSCAYVKPRALPEGVLVMVERDTVARVDVRARGVRTAEGVGIGDTEASVVARYDGRVRVTPHKYTGPTGHYLTVSAPPDSAHLIVFETDGKTVTRYRAGRRSAVELVEGCS